MPSSRSRRRAEHHDAATAVLTLGRGYLSHPANNPLRRWLCEDPCAGERFYAALLRVLFRLLFKRLAEQRGFPFPSGRPVGLLVSDLDEYQLADDDREVILMRHHEQLSNQDVAAALELTEAAASMRYLRAVRRLRDLLSGDFDESTGND